MDQNKEITQETEKREWKKPRLQKNDISETKGGINGSIDIDGFSGPM